MIRIRKDKTNLLGKWKLKTGPKYYFFIYLWKDQKSMEDNVPDVEKGTAEACTTFAQPILHISGSKSKLKILPKLGEMHFIKGRWSLEIVAHELCHALIHRITMIPPSFDQIRNQVGYSEETVCYEFGAWVRDLYRILSEHGD